MSTKNKPETALDKKLKLISSELDIMKPDTLMLNVDPSIEAREIIEQIQNYHSLIHQEMVELKHQETEERELQQKIKDQQKALEVLANSSDHKIRSSSMEIPKRKPTMDFKVKIRILEKDLNHTYQLYNNTKAKNEEHKKQLNELRKNVQINKEKVDRVTHELRINEKEFQEEREEIEKKLKTREDKKLLEKINLNQKTLRENNDILIQQIKTTDKDMTQKLAMKKYLELEKKKIEEKEKKIRLKWRNELKAFKEQHAEEIRKYQSFDQTSKVLSILSEEKMTKYEGMLKLISEKSEVNNIVSLVEYFINCTKEFKNFEDFTTSITGKVIELEKEVEELEFIINFCEQNLEIKNEKFVDEEESNLIEELKKAGEQFTHIQYHVILEQYKKYSDGMKKSILDLHPDWTDMVEEQDFIEFTKKNLQRTQETLLEIIAAMKARNKTKNQNQNADKDLHIDFSEVDSKFIQKSEKIKEGVKKDFDKIPYEKGGRVMNMNKMRNIIEPLLNIEKLQK